MEWTKEKVREELLRGYLGPDETCPYHPCHYRGQDCTYCFCPFYPCQDPELGEFVISSRDGEKVWSCVECHLMHREEPCRYVAGLVRDHKITDPDDPRLQAMFYDVKERFLLPGRSIMVLGATSGAGKSLTVTALCRIISNRRFSVSPFKSQNMSLNSYVTKGNHEISRIQHLQSLAARIEPDYRVNPILLKPKGDLVSQVIVDGKPFGDYDVQSYYRDFVPGPGTETLKRNVDFLRRKYDFMVMEGAGSPAEINIYDRDIANMRAAEVADADCLLVVNMKWGGAFAYAYGTVALLREDDRKRVKGIILNNMHGDVESLRPGISILEQELGIPVIGVIPHISLFLPTEDSMFFRESALPSSGKLKVAVIKLPWISNFTDFDALALEDLSVIFVEDPSALQGADAVIIPGTKNTIQGLRWMQQNGFAEALQNLKGKVPILGICGGYQMMGKSIDLQGLEDEGGAQIPALGLLSIVTKYISDEERTKQVEGKLISNGGPVRGYEVHGGITDSSCHQALFMLKDHAGEHLEGCCDDENMLYGTHMHGLFDTPSFRKKFLSMALKNDYKVSDRSYSEVVEENLEKLAEHFLKHIDSTKLELLLRGDL